MKIDLELSCAWPTTARTRQLEAMFDVTPQEKHHRRYSGDLPIEQREWNVGLIVGPSGAGKSTILENAFGREIKIEWSNAAVIDDFPPEFTIEQIAEVCQAVGFNTIPAWMRPYKFLSNGEQFRVRIARSLLEGAQRGDVIVLDEFTSVVDRQVGKIVSHSCQKYARRRKLKLVAATCHYDVIEWLRPDWILYPHEMRFEWTEGVRLRRPEIDCTIGRIPYAAWSMFAPYHYLTASLNRSARCFGLWANGYLACFCGVLYRPHARVRNVYGLSRVVTLPDWQGLGLAFVIMDALGAACKANNLRFRTYPAHPALVRAFDRSEKWLLEKRPGKFSSGQGRSGSARISSQRPCAVFEYIGPKMNESTTWLGMSNIPN